MRATLAAVVLVLALPAFAKAPAGKPAGNVRRIRTVYGERRDAMLKAMDRYFPPDVLWTRPDGGLFLWATLPEGMDSKALLADALKEKVAFVPGDSFHANGGGARTLRLNFSYCTPEVIEEGIRRLGVVIGRKMGV